MAHARLGLLFFAVPLGAMTLALLALCVKLAEAPALESAAMQAIVTQQRAQRWVPIFPPDGKIHITTSNAADGKGWSFKACDICAWQPGPTDVKPQDFTLTPTRIRIKPDRLPHYYYDLYHDAWYPERASVGPRNFTRARMRNEINEPVGYYYNPYEGPHARPIPPDAIPSSHDDYRPPDDIANRWPWISIDLETHSINQGGLAGPSWAAR